MPFAFLLADSLTIVGFTLMQMMIGRMREHKCHALVQFPTIIIAKVRSTSLSSGPCTHMTISSLFHMCRMRVECASTSLTELLNCVTRSRRPNGMNKRPRKLEATKTNVLRREALKNRETKWQNCRERLNRCPSQQIQLKQQDVFSPSLDCLDYKKQNIHANHSELSS